MVIWFSPTNKGEQLQFLRASLLYLPIYSLVLELLGVVLGIFGTVGWNCWIKIGSMDAPKLDSCHLRTSISHRLLCQRLRYSQVLRLLPLKWLWQRRLPPNNVGFCRGNEDIMGMSPALLLGRWWSQVFFQDDLAIRMRGHDDYHWLSMVNHGDWIWWFYLSILIYPWWRACSEHVRCWWDIPTRSGFSHGKPVGEIRNFRIADLPWTI